MTHYAALRLIHVAAAFAVFVLVGFEFGAAVLMKRAATSADVRRALSIGDGWRRFGGIAVVVLLAPGLYMAWKWGFPWWTILALISLVVVMAVGGVVTGGRQAVMLQKLGTGHTPLTEAETALVRDPALRWSLSLRTALTCGIVLLMVVKPPLLGAIGILAVVLAIGAVAAARRAQN